MPAFSPRIRGHIDEALTFLKWVLYACNIGLIVGAVAVAFHYGIDWAAQFRAHQPWVILFLPLGGVVIVLLYRWSGMERDRGTNLVLTALAILMWFLPTGPAYQTLWLAVILGNGIILGFTLPLHFSLMAFADDYGEWKTGVRSSGMNFAFNLFFIKLAWASSAGIISLLFIFVAYQPGAGNQTASSLQGITAMETLLPALFHLLLALSIRICKLNNPMMSRIATDLRQRHVQP